MKEIKITKNILNENSFLLQDFFKDINSYHYDSGEKQINLARKAQAGDERAREQLINSNLRFVVTCAKKYAGQGVPLIDLIQAGSLGLIQSLKNFNPDAGYTFLSFAVWYIRREILREIYNNGRTIRYPITYISNITKVKKAYDSFVAKNHREPTDDELLELTELSEKQYKSVLNGKTYCQSIDTPITEDKNTTLEDILPDEDSTDNFTKDAIHDALIILNEREYKVITEFYGLDGKTERSIKDIAKEMGLGDERVRQIRKAAIKKLQQRRYRMLKALL